MKNMLIIEEKTDIELYKDFLNGSNDSFNIIIKRYRKMLISFLMQYVKNIEIAEDLAQDAFLYMLVNKKEYDFKYTLKTYLYTIARSRAINYIKKESRIVKFDEDYSFNYELDKEQYNIEDIIITKEKYNMLYKNLNKLKKEYQIAIYLSNFKNFSYKEISLILQKTIPQTKMLIHRARKKLRKILEKEDVLC